MIAKEVYEARGKKVTTNQGYILVYCPEYPHAYNGKYVLEHRLVMANKLGRALKSTEHIHHLNGDKADNRIQNLAIRSNSEHLQEHNSYRTKEELKAQGRWLTAYAKSIKLPRNTIRCACGCGEELTDRDSKGRLRRYIHGHNNKKHTLEVENQ